jgi:hypothetical protein
LGRRMGRVGKGRGGGAVAIVLLSVRIGVRVRTVGIGRRRRDGSSSGKQGDRSIAPRARGRRIRRCRWLATSRGARRELGRRGSRSDGKGGGRGGRRGNSGSGRGVRSGDHRRGIDSHRRGRPWRRHWGFLYAPHRPVFFLASFLLLLLLLTFVYSRASRCGRSRRRPHLLPSRPSLLPLLQQPNLLRPFLPSQRLVRPPFRLLLGRLRPLHLHAIRFPHSSPLPFCFCLGLSDSYSRGALVPGYAGARDRSSRCCLGGATREGEGLYATSSATKTASGMVASCTSGHATSSEASTSSQGASSPASIAASRMSSRSAPADVLERVVLSRESSLPLRTARASRM